MKIFRNLIKKILNKIKTSYYKNRYKNLTFGINSWIIQPTVFSGKGKIIIKDNVKIGYKIGGFYKNNFTEIQARYKDSKIIINDNTSINNACFLLSANFIEIKQNCRIGSNVTMMDYEAHNINPNERNRLGEIGEIIIGENVWIGNNVIILKNVYIGKNSVVAAGSIVLKGNYPNNCVIGGNPAKVVKIF